MLIALLSGLLLAGPAAQPVLPGSVEHKLQRLQLHFASNAVKVSEGDPRRAYKSLFALRQPLKAVYEARVARKTEGAWPSGVVRLKLIVDPGGMIQGGLAIKDELGGGFGAACLKAIQGKQLRRYRPKGVASVELDARFSWSEAPPPVKPIIAKDASAQLKGIERAKQEARMGDAELLVRALVVRPKDKPTRRALTKALQRHQGALEAGYKQHFKGVIEARGGLKLEIGVDEARRLRVVKVIEDGFKAHPGFTAAISARLEQAGPLPEALSAVKGFQIRLIFRPRLLTAPQR